jgi:carbamoyltransferase
VAASIQAVTEEILVRMAKYLYKQTGSPNLCMAGGVALNSVANWKILQQTPFEQIFIQPAAGDSGSALGAALWGYHEVTGKPRSFVLEHAYWGDEPSEEEIAHFLQSQAIPHQRCAEDELLDRTVDTLQRGQVVGWLNGRFEWGPRALGNRSILADPRRAEMKDVVNAKIKFREPFRPFAPSVLGEHVAEHFEIDGQVDAYPARYMLYVVPVRDCSRERIPATTHVDGTGRLQVVDAATNPRYHQLIERWCQASGVPVVLNTSFNLRGEPIVNTPAEAFSTFMRSEMDTLVLGDYLIEKQQLRSG